jgi:hypothetical protein
VLAKEQAVAVATAKRGPLPGGAIGLGISDCRRTGLLGRSYESARRVHDWLRRRAVAVCLGRMLDEPVSITASRHSGIVFYRRSSCAVATSALSRPMQSGSGG